MTNATVRLVIFLIAAMIVAVLSCSRTLAQEDGAHTHPALEAGIAANADAIAERAEIDTAIGATVIDLEARVTALEDALAEPPAPEPPVVEPPIEPPAGNPIPLTLITEDGAAPVDGLMTVSGPFTLCAYAEDGVNGPVAFTRNGERLQTESQAAYCLFGGNDAPFPLETFPAGLTTITVTAPGFDATPVDIDINGPTGPPDPPVTEPPVVDPPPTQPPGTRALIQFGPWGAGLNAPEQPFANALRGGYSRFSYDRPFDPNNPSIGGGLIDPSLIDPATGLPRPGTAGKVVSDYYFGVQPEMVHEWNGCWRFDVIGDVAFANSGLTGGARRITDLRQEWCWDNSNTDGRVHVTELSDIGPGGIDFVGVFRTEDEARLRDGAIYSTKFLNYIAGYDIVRTLGIQNANDTFIRKTSQIPTLNYFYWGQSLKQPGPFIDGFQGPPLEALFRLGVESEAAVWMHLPGTLGYPEPASGALPDDVNARGAVARANAAAIMASPEWDRFADRFVSDLIVSGYPADKPLYVTLENEIWNGPFPKTNYIDNLGRGLYGSVYGTNPMREAYGHVFARHILEIERALAQAGRTQNIIYVVEGQNAGRGSIGAALKTLRQSILDAGGDYAALAPKIGASVTSYWGGPSNFSQFLAEDQWPIELANDPEGLKTRFADYLISTFDVGGGAFLLREWEFHAAAAAEYGVQFIGAYEGMSHLQKPDFVPVDWYTEFHWGPEGARVNTTINDALAARFPGVILSDYAGPGPLAPWDPWFEGLTVEDNPMKRSIDAYKRGEAQ